MNKLTHKKVLRSNSLNGSDVHNLVTINTLKQKKISGEKLTESQLKSLTVFEKYREQMLDSATSEKEYETKFKELSTLANLTSFEEFLSDKYSSSN